MIKSTKKNINQELSERSSAVFKGKPWYGRNMLSILSMSKEPLTTRALKILEHMIAWKTFVISHLQGEGLKIEINSEDDWPRINDDQEEIIARLTACQENLKNAILNFDENKWFDTPANFKFTYYQLCMGVIDHDIYHIGQIALEIKKSISD